MMTAKQYILQKYGRHVRVLPFPTLVKETGVSRQRISVIAKELGIKPQPVNGKVRGGFKYMSREKQLEISRLGGRTSQLKGTGHRFTPTEARKAVMIKMKKKGTHAKTS